MNKIEDCLVTVEMGRDVETNEVFVQFYCEATGSFLILRLNDKVHKTPYLGGCMRLEDCKELVHLLKESLIKSRNP